jgi:hypothetical protein
VAEDVPVTIYVQLADRLGEWRPVKAIRQREDIYCVIGPMPDDEEWKYPPGSMVRRKPGMLPNGKQEMMAAEV